MADSTVREIKEIALGTMKPNFQNISKLNIRQLSIEIYDTLSVTNRIALFEILSDDIYCQVGENESFVFSVDVRGDDTDFFYLI